MSSLILYTSDDGQAQINLRVEADCIWLSQLEIAELFQTTKKNVSLHAKNIFDEGELSPVATVKEFLTVQTEGSRQVQRAWRKQADGMLAFNGQGVLQNAGAVSHDDVMSIAHTRYDTFDDHRRASEALAADAADLQEIEQLEKRVGP